jgi:hypothetical protein
VIGSQARRSCATWRLPRDHSVIEGLYAYAEAADIHRFERGSVDHDGWLRVLEVGRRGGLGAQRGGRGGRDLGAHKVQMNGVGGIFLTPATASPS